MKKKKMEMQKDKYLLPNPLINIKNRDYWYIIKGIGILSVVIGHTWKAKYVYLYHLALFFFVGGYLYSEEKYGDRPWENVVSRLRKSWIKYVLFAAVFTLCQNLFLDLGIIINLPRYSRRDYLAGICNTILLQGGGRMAGALWFIPVMIVASGLLGMTVWIARQISHILKQEYIKYFLIVLQGIVLGVLGIALNLKGISLSYHIHTSFLVMPILVCGYFLRVFCADLRIILKFWAAVPLAIGFWYAVNKLHWWVDLAAEQIIGPWQFYVISVVGIYLCMYAAKVIQKTHILSKYFILIGKYSFEIMACHFLTTKIVDIIYAKMIGEINKEIYGKFVCAYSNELWPMYLLAGTLFIAVLFRSIDIFREKYNCNFYMRRIN